MKYVSVCVADAPYVATATLRCASSLADAATASKSEITPLIKGWDLNTEKISFLPPLSRSHVPSEYPFHLTLRERLRRTSFTLGSSLVILLSASTRACYKSSLLQGASARAVYEGAMFLRYCSVNLSGKPEVYAEWQFFSGPRG